MREPNVRHSVYTVSLKKSNEEDRDTKRSMALSGKTNHWWATEETPRIIQEWQNCEQEETTPIQVQKQLVCVFGKLTTDQEDERIPQKTWGSVGIDRVTETCDEGTPGHVADPFEICMIEV